MIVFIVFLVSEMNKNNPSFKGEGAECQTVNGTKWPFSGCDASAGTCCTGKCTSNVCPPTPQGGSCNLDSDCEGWELFGKVACCNHRCVKKAWTGQLCDAPTVGEPC